MGALYATAGRGCKGILRENVGRGLQSAAGKDDPENYGTLSLPPFCLEGWQILTRNLTLSTAAKCARKTERNLTIASPAICVTVCHTN